MRKRFLLGRSSPSITDLECVFSLKRAAPRRHRISEIAARVESFRTILHPPTHRRAAVIHRWAAHETIPESAPHLWATPWGPPPTLTIALLVHASRASRLTALPLAQP